MVKEIFSLVYKPENLQLRDKIQKRTVEKSAKKTQEIIKQGVEEGTFDTQYPQKVSRLVFWMGVDLGEEMATELLDPEMDVNAEKYLRSYRAYENAIARTLGEPIIETKRLTKFYGEHRGILNLDVEVKQGEVFGYLGPNGGGKTTTIRTLLDLIRPTEGKAKIFGKDVRLEGEEETEPEGGEINASNILLKTLRDKRKSFLW